MEEARRRLVNLLRELGYIRSRRVEEALLKVPREEFVPPEYRGLAYEDRPLPIGYGQTISAPSIVAYMTELLDPGPGMKVLEVGTGSGYQAAVLAELVGEEGHVWSIERIPELAEWARGNLERTGYGDRVTVIVGDGSLGYPKAAPYHRIIVTAAAPAIPPPLEEQLMEGGRIVAPVGDMIAQDLVVGEKRGGAMVYRRDIGVIFVPLVGEYGWKSERVH
ncbi:MAG: protein-L-isoaspartate(D-aspartate) O-methyltransferase [Desulfurococcales archaeon]|nr:protein-L-isoaspartate(D-aspartate) O-methyltransferase [Desulfurococcales archaeon]